MSAIPPDTSSPSASSSSTPSPSTSSPSTSPSDEPATRERTVRWQSPRSVLRQAVGKSGLELMRALLDGDLPAPPIGPTLGFRLAAVGEGTAAFELDPGEHQYNPIGSVHGGVIATVLDSAMGCAVHTTLPVGAGYTSLDLQVRFVRAVAADTGTLVCRGEVVHVGGRTAVGEARLEDAEGRLYATGTTTCLLFRS
ncbi:MAG: PaaI family thioesterase [Acidobacteriota bacterium]